jgi:hypothetical protein
MKRVSEYDYDDPKKIKAGTATPIEYKLLKEVM